MNRRTLVTGLVLLTGVALGLTFWLAKRSDMPTTAPLPAVGTATPPSGPTDVPTFDVVRLNPDGTAVIAGRARPGVTVTVLDGDTVIGSVAADKHGEWVLLTEKPFAPGGRQLTLRAPDGQGKDVASTETVTLVVPDAKRDIAGRKQTETSGALAVATSRQGGSRVLMLPGRPSGAGAVAIDAIDYDAAGLVHIGGRGPAKAAAQLYLDNTLVGRAVVDASGRWQVTLERPLDVGHYTVRVDVVGEDGKVAARAEVVFDRQAIADAPGDSRAVVVLPGNNLWTLARRLYGEGVQYTVIYEANHDEIRDPDLIYPGQIFMLPVTAPPHGG